jgi:hypothetical protein
MHEVVWGVIWLLGICLLGVAGVVAILLYYAATE